MSSLHMTLYVLFDACERGDLPTVRQVVADGLDLKNSRSDRYFGGYIHYNSTPLHVACWYVSTLHPLQ